MSQTLTDLIKEYGDARADWMAGGSNRVPEALAAVEGRIEQILAPIYEARRSGGLIFTLAQMRQLDDAIELLIGERPS